MKKKKKPAAPPSLLEAAKYALEYFEANQAGDHEVFFCVPRMKKLRADIAAHEANIPGDPMKLARMIVDNYGEAIEMDEEINGGDLVDFLTRELYPEALAICQDDDNKKEGR